MSINTKQPHLIGAFILLLGLGLVGCDSTDTSEGDFSSLEVQDLYNSVTSELGMTDPQQRRFANALARHDSRRREPGYLWIVADSLAKTLSDEQIEELLSRTAPMEGVGVFRGLAGFPGGGGFYGLGGFKGASNRHGESPLDEALGLTDEQVEAIHAIHEAFRADVRALRTALRNGEITKEEFLQSIIELHAALKQAVSDVLTDEQKAIIENFHGRREAAFMQFRDDENEFQKLVHARSCFCRDRGPRHIASELFKVHALLKDSRLRALHIGIRLVYLIDCNDEGDSGFFDARQGLKGLRLHAVVGGDDKDGDVGDVGATSTNGGESGMPRGVDERDALFCASSVTLDLIGGDVLGNATRFFCDRIRFPYEIKKRGFAVVHVSHNDHNRGSLCRIVGFRCHIR